MRPFDFAPVYGSTIGFDRLFDTLNTGERSDRPPYNIEKTGEDDYRITMAVAGFETGDIALTQNGFELTVVGNVAAAGGEHQLLHRGLDLDAFTQTFRLAKHVRVASANLANGLLTIELVREVPEALKPRRIAIATGAPDNVAPDAAAERLAA
jgi:molecular chaperone IbpA